MRVLDLDRAVAFERLLALPDERSLKRRGHVRTHPGKPDRFAALWLRSSRTWIAQRLASTNAAIEGWTPAVTASRVRQFGTRR